jgi:hypothetical protein
MLTKPELIHQLAGTMGKTKVAKLSTIISTSNFDLDDLIELTFSSDKNIAFRAAWLLENTFLKRPLKYLDKTDAITGRIKEVKHPACKRHYAKIMMHLTSPQAHPRIRQKINDTDLEQVVEQCFDWMIDPAVLIAVKAFASEALFNMRHRYPWVAEELAKQLEYLMLNGTAAIQSKGRRLLGFLNPLL